VLPHDRPDRLPLYLTVEEVAALLRTTRVAVCAMVGRAQIPGVTRVGRRLLFNRGCLVDWLDQNRAPSPRKE
jgi:excisionase family DNA binding protein